MLHFSSQWLWATQFWKLHISKLPFCSFHHTAAVRADTWGISDCIGIHRAPCQPRMPSAYRQQRPFSLSLTRSLKYQAEVTHPGLMLILTIMRNDGPLNIPYITKLNRILHEKVKRECPRHLGVPLDLWGLSKDHRNPLKGLTLHTEKMMITWAHYHSSKGQERVKTKNIKTKESYKTSKRETYIGLMHKGERGDVEKPLKKLIRR